ncbi:MAG: MarR family transcriptional regulator [Deltaproteobacteria bacterium]|nr:MarR family transcriptional regulator [Deltaproteobacteria bacterium]MBN2687495.1 MarR family transcriptional regulator [Deltaproteobacteria bacterium]
MAQDDRLIFLLLTAQQKLRNYLKDELTKAGVKTTIAQGGILALLKQNNGRTMTELSQILSIDNSTITGLIDRLEKAGFAKRNSHPQDRRVSQIMITPEGIDEVERSIAVIRRVNEEVKKGFTPDEVEAFKNVLGSFFEKFKK